MHRIKIAIDPQLRAEHGPEVCWAWRLLLAGIGYAWEEVAPDDPACDIAHVADRGQAPWARLTVKADPERWAQPDAWRLGRVASADGLEYPCYMGEAARPTPLAIADGRAVCERDLIFDVFWLATGQEEARLPKGAHGYLELEGSPYLRDNALRRGLASGIGAALERALAALGTPPPLPRWPYGRSAAACASHDVDYPEVIRWLEPLRVLARQGARGLPNALAVLAGRRHHWHFASWVEMERQLGTRSAFYFVARKGSLPEYARGTPDSFYDIRAPRFRELFRFLREQGAEIGLHGSYNAYLSPEQFAAEKRALEEASGGPVIGHRHHYWHLDPTDPEATLLAHERLGFQYDASLTNDHYVGWRRGLCWPFFPFHRGLRRPLRTLQLPTGWMDDQLFGQKAANPGEPAEILRDLAGRAAAQGGLLLIDIHDYVYDDALFPGWARAYRELWEHIIARGDYWLDTPARIAEHWSERDATIARASRGLEAAPQQAAVERAQLAV